MAELYLLIPIGLSALMIALPGITTVAMCCGRTRQPTRVWHFVTRGLLLVGILATLFVVLPRYKAHFLGFGTELPGITVLWLQISDLANAYFGTFLAMVMLAVAAESAVFEWLLRKNSADDRDALFFPKLCSTLVTGSLALLMAFSAVAVFMPSVKLLNDLS